MAAIYAREKDGDNSIQVQWGIKFPESITNQTIAERITTLLFFDIAPYMTYTI